MTIKKRIVIWYTLMMAVLGAIMVAAIVSASGIMLRQEALSDLREAVSDASEDIRWRSGNPDFHDVDFFDEGIYIQIFDESGVLIEGRASDDLPSVPVSVDDLREVPGIRGQWYVLDELVGDGLVVRGILRSYGEGAYMSLMEVFALLVFLVVMALGGLGGYIIVRRSFKPVDQVIAAADDIASSGDVSKRIGLGGGSDEIHRMASSFDAVLERLEEAFEKEKRFTSDASHELRTPLSVILAECEYALEHVDDCARMEESLSDIQRQAGRMSRLVEELLALARADKGTLNVSYEDVDLSELAHMVLSSLEDKAASRSITLTLKTDPAVHVDADQGMLTRVLINYLGNAIEHGNEGGWALLRIRDLGQEVEVSVEDNGPGIAKEDLEKVWDRFWQGDSSRSASGGAGLGLSMVRWIAQAHGGSVGVESSPGNGSVFYFTIPKKPV